MTKRRNYSTKEIIEVVPVDLTVGLDTSVSDGGVVIDGGSNTEEVGVPKNFTIVSQTPIDYYGEDRVQVVIEFDAVPGATNYASENIQLTPTPLPFSEVPE